jgi:hypothetical protein
MGLADGPLLGFELGFDDGSMLGFKVGFNGGLLLRIAVGLLMGTAPGSPRRLDFNVGWLFGAAVV